MRAKRPAPGEILNAESTIESQYLKLRGRCWYATVCWKTCSRGAYCSLAVGVLRALIHNLIGRELHSYNVQTDSYGFIGLLLLASRSPLLAESFTQSDQLSPSDAAGRPSSGKHCPCMAQLRVALQLVQLVLILVDVAHSRAVERESSAMST